MGNFLKDIASCASDLGIAHIARELRKRPEYGDRSVRQLRRMVGEAVDEHIHLLEGVRPTPTNRKMLRAKAFEHLRHALDRHHKYMAKKQ
jgi:hypothetical protein